MLHNLGACIEIDVPVLCLYFKSDIMWPENYTYVYMYIFTCVVLLTGLGLISPNPAFATMVTTFGLAGIVGK